MPSVQPLFIPLPPGHPAAPANDTTATATAADRDPVAHARMLMRRAVTAREVEADAYDDRSARYTRGVAGAIVVGALAALLAVTVDAWVFTAATGASGFFGLACLVACRSTTSRRARRTTAPRSAATAATPPSCNCARRAVTSARSCRPANSPPPSDPPLATCGGLLHPLVEDRLTAVHRSFGLLHRLSE